MGSPVAGTSLLSCAQMSGSSRAAPVAFRAHYVPFPSLPSRGSTPQLVLGIQASKEKEKQTQVLSARKQPDLGRERGSCAEPLLCLYSPGYKGNHPATLKYFGPWSSPWPCPGSSLTVQVLQGALLPFAPQIFDACSWMLQNHCSSHTHCQPLGGFWSIPLPQPMLWSAGLKDHYLNVLYNYTIRSCCIYITVTCFIISTSCHKSQKSINVLTKRVTGISQGLLRGVTLTILQTTEQQELTADVGSAKGCLQG